MLSTPVLEAPSISITSTNRPSATSEQAGQRLHGSPASGAAQLSALANSRAVVVLPTPRGPEKR